MPLEPEPWHCDGPCNADHTGQGWIVRVGETDFEGHAVPLVKIYCNDCVGSMEVPHEPPT